MKKSPGQTITNILFNRSKISDEDLSTCDQRGWIPGPQEEVEPFLDRVEALDHFFSYPPEQIDHFLTDTDWIETRHRTEQLFDLCPDWIVAHFSNKQLSFFQGAATWIVEQKGVRIPLIQLKEKFESGSLLKLYSLDEVLSHEVVHAARMAFDEPHFEEILAYKTSSRWWRRFFGPLFERPWEAYLFITILFVPFALEMAQFFWPLEPFLILRYLPLAFFALLTLRLSTLQLFLHRALKKLKPFLQAKAKPLAVALRLTDREICTFAWASEKKLGELISKEKSLRWRLLKKKYFK